ncbi:hypothetical protein Tco_0674485 [Tanacetum coccineum]
MFVETSDFLLEELIAKIRLNDSILTGIDDGYYDSEGDILYLEQLLNEDTSSDVSPTLLPKEPSTLVSPLLASDPGSYDEFKDISNLDPPELTPVIDESSLLSGGTTRVMATPSFGFHHMLSPRPIVYSHTEVMYGEHEGSDDYTKQIPVKGNMMKFIKFSVDDLVPTQRSLTGVVTSDSNSECDIADTCHHWSGLPRHLVKRLFSHLVKNPSLTKGMSDEPLGDDSKTRSYDVTLSNPLFNFNDDYTLCYDNPLFDDEFEDISSLDLPELTLVIDESTLLVTLPLPCTDVLGDVIVDIDLLLGEHIDTLSTGDKEIDFNAIREIEELERLLADNPVPVPRVFDGPLGNYDSMSRSSETSDLFEELIAEIGLDDSIPTEINDMYYDSEGDIIYFEQLLNEDTSSDVSLALLPTGFFSLDLPLLDPKQNLLFDPFLEIPSDESKVHIEVLTVLWGNRLSILDGSLPLSRYEVRLQVQMAAQGSIAGTSGSELAMIGLEYEANHWQIKAMPGNFQAVSCTRSSTRNDISTPLSWALIGWRSKKTKIPLRAWAIKWTPHAADASF